MPNDDRLRIAVFIDFDNIEIGVKNTLNVSFDAGLVLEALKERGEVVSKTAYSDWQRAGGYSRMLTQHAIRMVQRNLTPGGDKNGADINLALDALEMAFTHSHINAYVIVGGDSDFISLVEKLKQYDKKVFIVGGRGFTSHILQRNCSEFIAYENLIGATPAATGASARRHAGRPDRGERTATDIGQAIPLVSRALKVLADREVSPQLGLLKSTLLQLDSTFSERTYGVSSFRDFAEKLERAGVLKVHHAKGGWIVAPAEAVPVNGDAAASQNGDAGAPEEAASAAAESPERQPVAPLERGSSAETQARTVPAVIGTTAEGVRELRRILGAAEIRRWPMYLRNVKQAMRQVAPSFDERAYGFPNLTDLLRAAHKDGVVRVDRDRQGIVRVFQGAAPVAPAAAPGTGAPAPTEIDTPDSDAIAAVPILPAIAEQSDEDNDGQIATGAVSLASEPGAVSPARRRRPRGGASSDSQRRPRTRRPKA